MKRSEMLSRILLQTEPWSIVVIGGGATGVGVALDAASRGYQTLLLERHDFGKGTSSRSTKLAHGGVRYLEQGNIPLVIEALKERSILRRNAPHLVSELQFIVPSYAWWEGPFYGLGLKLYQGLSGKHGFGASKLLSREETLARLPTLRTDGLRGGVVYYDGQFDDTRLLINLASTAVERGATVLNYAPVTGLLKDADGRVAGVRALDLETGMELTAHAKVVINATGPFTDAVRNLANPGVRPMIAPSQGAHLVLDRSFLPGDTAILVPHTSDGRVMFAIPWHGHTLLGTTDTPIDFVPLEPVPLDQEIEFLLETAGEYLEKKPLRTDVLSAFAGVRPLVRSGDGKNTAGLSRDHTVQSDPCGLLSVAGGKWTTYRYMAEDCVNQAATQAGLAAHPCVTRRLDIHGFDLHDGPFASLACYGADAPLIQNLIREDPCLGEPLDPVLTICGAEVVWAVREEMARGVEDVLARRTRALFLNAQAAIRMAPRVARLMAGELQRDARWEANQVTAFISTARGYQLRAAGTQERAGR
jgi:glycerol-3-phosphate dehydrogenase